MAISWGTPVACTTTSSTTTKSVSINTSGNGSILWGIGSCHSTNTLTATYGPSGVGQSMTALGPADTGTNTRVYLFYLFNPDSTAGNSIKFTCNTTDTIGGGAIEALGCDTITAPDSGTAGPTTTTSYTDSQTIPTNGFSIMALIGASAATITGGTNTTISQLEATAYGTGFAYSTTSGGTLNVTSSNQLFISVMAGFGPPVTSTGNAISFGHFA